MGYQLQFAGIELQFVKMFGFQLDLDKETKCL